MTGFRRLARHEVLRVVLDDNGSNQEIVAAVADKKIVVIAALLATSGADDVIFLSDDGASPLQILKMEAKAADAPVALPWNPDGWFETRVGDALDLTAAAATVTGVLLYIEV